MKKPKILIVEDEAIVARDIQQQLVVMGYDVAGLATRGEEAIALAGYRQPDLVLMDIHLAGAMDGIAAAEIIRGRFAIPVVFLTAFAEPETLARAKLTEPFGYVLKPFSERELRTVLEMALYKHQADAKVRESEQRFRTIFESEPECVKVLGPEGELLEMNAAGLAFLEADTVEQVRGRGLIEFVLPEYRAAFGTLHKRVMAGNNALLAFEISGLKGTLRWLETHASPMRNASGKVINMLGVTRDITARRLAEDKLRVIDLALRAVTEGVLITGPDQRINWVNDTFLSIIGYDEGEVLGRTCRFLQGPLTDPQAIEAIRLATTKATTISSEILNYRKDGSTFWNELSISPVYGARGQVSHFIGIMRDISARKQADLILRKSEQQLRLVIRGGNLGLWDLNVSTGALAVNDRWLAMLGLDPNGPMPTMASWHALLHPDDAVALDQRLAQLIRDPAQSEFEIELRARHASGRYVWILKKGAVVERNADGSPRRVTGTHMDISPRKEAEAERASLETQLRESQKMEAIGTLAGGIAHDFNNILATILGNTELARQDMSNNPLALQSLEEIRKAGARARDLVQQILSFSRRQPTEKKPIALCTVIKESVRLLRATLPARLALEVDCDPQTPAVMADATQIEQVVINLVTNAMQAMTGGPGRIGITLDTVMLDPALANTLPALRSLYATHPGQTVRLAVSDTGRGMDAATLARIFEPFFTTKPVDQGTGLGLSVVHGIVQGHEGAIVVDSQPGKGATFTLYLPVAARAEEAAAGERAGAPGSSSGPGSGSGGTGHGEHIAYIDDDESLVFLVSRLLERRGFRVSGFTEQQAALAALRADPQGFTLVVTDYNMPGMSGLDVAREIRTIRADLPVAVASGFIDEALRAQAEGAGVRELIFKANALEDLCDAFARLAQHCAKK